MNSATTVTWRSWSEKWGNWNIWRRLGSNRDLGSKSVKVMTFDDLLQPHLHVAETSSSDPTRDPSAKLKALSVAASATASR